MTAPTIIPSAEVRDAALYDAAYRDALAAYGPDELRVALLDLREDLNGPRDPVGRDPGWRHRLAHLRTRVDARLSDVNQQIKHRNREESATAEARDRTWGIFAERIARALYLSDPAALEAIHAPRDPDLNAQDWLLMRIRKRLDDGYAWDEQSAEWRRP